MLVRAVEAVDYACARAPNVRFAPTDTGRAGGERELTGTLGLDRWIQLDHFAQAIRR